MKTEWLVGTYNAEQLTELLNDGWFCEKMSTNVPLVGEILITVILSKVKENKK